MLLVNKGWLDQRICKNLFFWYMAQKQQSFTKTPFKRQANIIAALLNTNPIVNDDEKASLNETAGVLVWLNQLQLHWESGKEGIPPDIMKHIFDGRTPTKQAAQSET